jgi:hypothetical protein
MVPPLQEVDAVLPDQVDDAVFGGQAAAPHVGPQVLQRFGLADASERVTHHGFDDVERPSGSLGIGRDPPREILAELILENGDALLLSRS